MRWNYWGAWNDSLIMNKTTATDDQGCVDAAAVNGDQTIGDGEDGVALLLPKKKNDGRSGANKAKEINAGTKGAH